MGADILSYIYASAVAAGGIIGYVKAGNYNKNFFKKFKCLL